MQANGGKNVRLLLAAGFVVGTLGVVGLAPATVAGATSSVTLYVRTGATGHACTAPTGTNACDSIGRAVTVASRLHGTVTITVGYGTYPTVNVTLSTGGESSLTIKGAGATATVFYRTGTGTCTGRCTGRGSVFLLETGAVPVTIEGAAIVDGTAADGTGGGIDGYAGKTFVLRNDFFAFDDAKARGGAVNVTSSSHASFIDDTFTYDLATRTGGAVAVSGRGVATFLGDNFTRDGARTGGAVMAITGASASFTNDVFTTDHARRGGAIAVFNTSFATVSGASFYDDAATYGGAVAAILSTVKVDTSDIAGSCYVYRPTPPRSVSGTNDVLSGTAVPSCLQYFHPRVSATCLAGTTACASSQGRPGKSVTVESHGASATYTGHGSVGIGTFRSDPVGAFGGSGATFFAVSISTGTGAESLVIGVPSADAGNALMWWNGSAWQPVDAIASCGTTTCAEFIFSATSTPSLATIVKLSRTSRLGGVLFAIG